MESEFATIVRAAPGRLIGLGHDGALRLVWDHAAVRLPAFDLPHLAAALDEWHRDEELATLRRGYYRLTRDTAGGVQLWLHSVGLMLSREELRVFASLVSAAANELCRPMCRQRGSPLGLGYRPMVARTGEIDRQN